MSSLADQQWCPTSVQVTVLQARGLRIKGKSGANDAYALMQVGKEKFQTSVVEKSVAPVWKEEASFDLPQGGGGGKERGGLQVQVLHRALVGPDKLLGQAVINLLQLSEDKTRNKTEWFKLLDKTGKPDKDRGEVLLDIQFLRNNMTASMFDLSAAGKSRSRLGKLKDKVRGKKKELDSSSGVAPSHSQVVTDSEEEDASGGGEGGLGKDGKSKRHKRMSLFSPASNLQRNMSQSMSVLPAKNSSLSSSQSSGLNVDASEGKKKFKFKIHKHSSSSESKNSSSGQQKQEQSNLCINGSHVYCEDPPPRTSRTGSSFSLSSSGRGSMEDVPENSSQSVESLRAVREYSPWMEEEEEMDENIEDFKNEEEKVKLDTREEEDEANGKKQKELQRLAEEKLRREEAAKVRKEEEERKRLAEEKRIQEEQEKRRREEEEMARQKEEHKIAEEKQKQREKEERMIEEEKIRKKREKAEEERREKEQEEKRQREEEEMLRKEKARMEEEKEHSRLMAEKKREEERIEAEEKFRKAEEERIRQEEELKKEHEEKLAKKKEMEEEERRKEVEKIREEEERKKKEEGERLRRLEELERLAQEKLRQEEEERRKAEEERVKREEEERIRKEEELKKEHEEKLAKKKEMEEEERRKELEKIREEEERKKEMGKIKEEEEKKKKEEEERLRRLEELERLAQEKLRQEEEERREAEEQAKREEEMIQKEKMRKEEERKKKQEEEEQKRKQEELERLAKEKLRQEEEERRKAEEQVKREEEDERIQREKMRREEEKAKKTLEDEMREKKRKDEEERIKRDEQQKVMEGKRAEERIKEGKRREEEREKKMLEDERREEEKERREDERKLEKMAKENKIKQEAKSVGTKLKLRIPAEITSTNPFDEEETPNTSKAKADDQRCLDVESGAVPAHEKNPINAQREKRAAPKPPANNQPESRRRNEEETSTQHLSQMNKQGKDKDVKTVSVAPQRSVLMIAPLNRSSKDLKETQSVTEQESAKHNKRPAPSIPCTNAEKLHRGVLERKEDGTVCGLNPFEDDDENEDATSFDKTDPECWPPTKSQTADKDAAKVKSSKITRAPLPPATHDPLTSSVIGQSHDERDASDDAGAAAPNKAWNPRQEVKGHVQFQDDPNKCSKQTLTGVKEVGPPASSRRLQPVKPLNALEQRSDSVGKDGNDNRATELDCNGVQHKTNVGAGRSGPYSQLTREELIALLLKQESQLLERDKKISELEQYIDNLLVRVIEENPSILLSMSSLKKVA